MDLDLLGKINKYIKELLDRKGHVSVFLFSFLTVLALYTIINPGTYIRYKNAVAILYVIYAIFFFTKKFKDTLYTLLTLFFIMVVTSFIGIDINNKIGGSIGTYFPMMLFNFFLTRYMLVNYYERRFSKNKFTFLESTILSILCLILSVNGILKNRLHVFIFCLIYTVLVCILIHKIGRKKEEVKLKL